ncbi:apoptosis-stimulating of p53 protein 1 isoform X1 [Salmo salar]|uniref:Apoptosis-stimulating of p53 protein 1 isoform X1 n=2 Tax=Salmo salar TaxID=8030 RepID=A0A1S3R8B1_SALSA|nr:apoptosis-stimulating of p53 protein 1 isoform X1 [Salmo salar]|eukprot:XP_014048366.1 PREDICTED: apoptosis-stimulating of p53 protein 1-like isoform X1 [Salmo salar]
MKRFFSMVLHSLVSVTKDKDKAWLHQRVRPRPQPQQQRNQGKKTPCWAAKMILTVYLSDSQQMLTEVPITPETTCKNVVEFCKEAGENGCHLAEVWKGKERVIPFDYLMYEHLQKWGSRRMEVRFYLRHEDSPSESRNQGSQLSQDQSNKGSRGSSDQPCEDRVGNPSVELSLSELQEMATRQQQQIEAQQQMLVAKEQRLRYLKQQDNTHGQTASEAEKLQRLKERVESQEAKLKKIRAMRGQVDYSKLINGNLSAEIQHVSGLFQEKQAELQSAVVKVDQLTQQLEDLRRGRLNGLQPLGGPLSGTAALELRKLYQELQVRNKLNAEQSGRLQQNKELLNKRNTEVTMMDKRIWDLRERLHKKKAEARQKENNPLNRINGPPSPQPTPSSSGRVAAVCPYIQVPVPGRQEGGYALPPDPLKPQSVPGTGPINHGRSKSAEEEGCGVRKPSGQWKVSDLDIIVDPVELREGPRSPSGAHGANTNDAVWPTLSKSISSRQPSDWRKTSPDQSLDSSKLPGGSVSKPPPIYGTYPAPTGHPSIVCSTSSLPRSAPATLAWQRSAPTPAPPGSSSQQIQQRISVPPSPTPQPGQGERPDPPLAVAVRPYVPDRSSSRPQSPRKGPATMNSSSIYHMYLQQPAAKSYPVGGRSAVKAVYGKPVLPSSTSPSPVPFQHGALSPGGGLGGGEDMVDREGDTTEGRLLPPPSVENIPRPLSPTKLTPVAHSPLRYQSDADLEVLRRRLTNAPRPLKKRSSITEPEGPTGPNIQKLLYQRFNTLAGGMEGSNNTPFYQPVFMGGVLGCPDMDNINTANGNLMETASLVVTAAEGPNSDHRLSPSSDSNENQQQRTPPPSETIPCLPTPQPSLEDNNNNNQPGPTTTSTTSTTRPIPEASSPQQKDTSPRTVTPPALPKQIKRTNLKKPESERTGHGLRVKFNPLALLLDASLEGEFDLVQRIIYEVENPSTANDEGITPLHNAVCAGHHHIVKFLLDFGVNVNAADSDGWTPLHCAASCNSVHLCKMLVESGAAIFATTISDVETAADKCEEMEDGYTQCSQFLYGVQEKLGVMNKGSVYGLWDYEAQSSDELSFHEGDAITTLSRRDDAETEWWWARLHDKEGYVPRNLLGLYPRIKPRQRSLA